MSALNSLKHLLLVLREGSSVSEKQLTELLAERCDLCDKINTLQCHDYYYSRHLKQMSKPSYSSSRDGSSSFEEICEVPLSQRGDNYHKGLELWSLLFGMINTRPDLLANLCVDIPYARMDSTTRMITQTIFSNPFDHTQCHILLRIIEFTLTHEYYECDDLTTFMRENTTGNKLVNSFMRRPDISQVTEKIVAAVGSQIIVDPEDDLETDPASIVEAQVLGLVCLSLNFFLFVCFSYLVLFLTQESAKESGILGGSGMLLVVDDGAGGDDDGTESGGTAGDDDTFDTRTVAIIESRREKLSQMVRFYIDAVCGMIDNGKKDKDSSSDSDSDSDLANDEYPASFRLLCQILWQIWYDDADDSYAELTDRQREAMAIGCVLQFVFLRILNPKIQVDTHARIRQVKGTSDVARSRIRRRGNRIAKIVMCIVYDAAIGVYSADPAADADGDDVAEATAAAADEDEKDSGGSADAADSKSDEDKDDEEESQITVCFIARVACIVFA